MDNPIQTLLCSLGICDEAAIVPFFPKVRDRDDVSVLRCEKSGVMFLSRADHLEPSHYEDHEGFTYWDAADRTSAVRSGLEDARRRYDQFREVICNRKWIDVGSGAGGLLDLLAPVASATVAVEPQQQARAALQAAGYSVYGSMDDVPDNDFEVATLFHVLEHLPQPVESLKEIRRKMCAGGNIIVEVPHARDFLMSFLNLEAFKAFTFWSEHLILHTRESLRTVLAAAGFSQIAIYGWQRYPLANHLHWLAKGAPGGHIAWAHLRTEDLERAYGAMLARLDQTDTLVATAVN